MPSEDNELIAVLQTVKGDIRVKLFPGEAPLTVANFTEASTADVYISGGHKSSNSMNLSIPSGLGVPTTSGTFQIQNFVPCYL